MPISTKAKPASTSSKTTSQRAANGAADDAFKRVGDAVKALRGLPRGAQRRGLENCCRMFLAIEADLDTALPAIQAIPKRGATLVETLYLLRGIAKMAAEKEGIGKVARLG